MDKQLQTGGTVHLDEQIVRAKAHQLWLERGCPEGSADQDWFQAEKLLREVEQAAHAAPHADSRASTPAADQARRGARGGRAPTTAARNGAVSSQRKPTTAKAPLNPEPNSTEQSASGGRTAAGKTGQRAEGASSRPAPPTNGSQAPRSASAKRAAKRTSGSKKGSGRRR